MTDKKRADTAVRIIYGRSFRSKGDSQGYPGPDKKAVFNQKIHPAPEHESSRHAVFKTWPNIQPIERTFY
jgi:hypothetical protein